MLAMVSAWADHWTGPSDSRYPSYAAFVLQTRVNGTVVGGEEVEIAAFIDGECRGVKTIRDGVKKGEYNLYVWGANAPIPANNLASDVGKTITLKVLYRNIVYKVKTDYKYTADENTIHAVINLDAPTGLKFDKIQKSSKTYPATFDLSNETYTFEYTSGYVPMGETEIDNTETQFDGYGNWWSQSEGVEVDQNTGVATFSKPTEDWPAYIGMEAYFKTGDQRATFYPHMEVEALLTQVPVTGISVTPTKVEIPDEYTWDKFKALFTVTVEPEDATNQNWYFSNSLITSNGTYVGHQTMYVISDDNQEFQAPVDVEVYKRVNEISLNDGVDELHVPVGTTAAELDDLIKSHYTIVPADAKYASHVAWKWADFESEAPSATSPSPMIDGVVKTTGRFGVNIAAYDEPNLLSEHAHNYINVYVYQPVTGITLEKNTIEVPVGDYSVLAVYNRLGVKVLPENAENPKWLTSNDFNPEEAGTYIVTFYSAEDQAIQTTATVEVYEPVTELFWQDEVPTLTVGMTEAEVDAYFKSKIEAYPEYAKYRDHISWAWGAVDEDSDANPIIKTPIENGKVVKRPDGENTYRVDVVIEDEPNLDLIDAEPLYCTIWPQVVQPVKTLTVDPKTVYVPIGTSWEEVFANYVTVTIEPEDADVQEYGVDQIDGDYVLDWDGAMEGTGTYRVYSYYDENIYDDFTITGFWPAGGVEVYEDPLVVYAGATLEEILGNAYASSPDGNHTITIRTEEGVTLFDENGGAKPGEYTITYVITDPDGREYTETITLNVLVKATGLEVVWQGYPETAAPDSRWNPTTQPFIHVPVGHSLKEAHEAGKFTVHVLPAEANQNVTFEKAGNSGAASYDTPLETRHTPWVFKVVSEDNSEVSLNLFALTFTPVESYSVENIVVPVGTSVASVMEGLQVTMSPADATRADYDVRYTGTETLGDTYNKVGVYTYELYATDYFLLTPVKTTFTVTVNNPMTDLLVKEDFAKDETRKVADLIVNLNEDVWAMMKERVEVVPADAENQELAFRYVEGNAGTTEVLNHLNGSSEKAGYGVYEVYAVNYSNLTVLFNITVKPELELTIAMEDLTKYGIMGLGIESNMPGDIDTEKIQLVFLPNSMTGQPCAVCESIEEITIPVTGEKAWIANCRGLAAGPGKYRLNYDGKRMSSGDLFVRAEIAVEPGWQWMAPFAFVQEPGSSEVGIDFNTINLGSAADDPVYISDLRSQTGLLFNDPEWGIVGDITKFSPADGMYKLKANYEVADYFNLGKNWTFAYGTTGKAVTRKGYNWIAYRQEFSRTFESVKAWLDSKHIGSEGDMIIGKNGFAQYYEGEWTAAADFVMHGGEGFLYYTENPSGEVIDFASDDYEKLAYSEADKELNGFVVKAQSSRRAARANSPWQYDSSLFADNMAIVAQMPGVKYAEEWTIGAFVGDECRGKGSFVSDDKMMINVAGKSGEKVTFRMLNTVSGEMFDIDESLTYTQMAGSLKAPVQFSSRLVTGLESINTDAAAEKVYDLTGRRVSTQAKGIVIKNGKVQVNK